MVASAEKDRPNRMSRKRERTRGRLVDAALAVIAEKGADAATINDITETADVGFGSFYNHFSSKEEILAAAIDEMLERIGSQIDGTVAQFPDPREALAAALRLFISLLIAKPQWAKFLLRISSIPGFNKAGLFPRLFRDIRKAEEAGRLRIADSGTVPYAVGGAMLFLVIALQDGDLPAAGAPERITAAALRMLGLTEEEILSLVSRPLPAITLAPSDS